MLSPTLAISKCK